MAGRFLTQSDLFLDAALVAESDLAARWNKSSRTLQRMRARREGPAWFTIGRTVFYRTGDILDYEKNARHGESL